MTKYYFWKLGNPEGVKAICEFTLNWVPQSRPTKNGETF